MLDIKELTNDMDMIINGIDSMILSRQQTQTMKSQLSDAPNNFEYSDTNILNNTNSKLTKILKTGKREMDDKEITNLLQEDSSNEKVLNDLDLKKMKEELNLKANTQEMREYLSQEESGVIIQSHPFLNSETDRTELRKSLEKYAANLERIEEESNTVTKDSSVRKERALKMNEDTQDESIKFEITKENTRKQKPPMKRYYQTFLIN
jgi:hypothetical protein